MNWVGWVGFYWVMEWMRLKEKSGHHYIEKRLTPNKTWAAAVSRMHGVFAQGCRNVATYQSEAPMEHKSILLLEGIAAHYFFKGTHRRVVAACGRVVLKRGPSLCGLLSGAWLGHQL